MSEINVTTIKNENADYGPNLVGYSTVTGDLNVTGSLRVGGGVTVSGITTFSDDITFDGNVSVGDSITLYAATGIITAAKYHGDGSELVNLPSSAGLGTALSEDTTSPLNVIYYTDASLAIGATITVDAPDSAKVAYTQYPQVTLNGSADLIVAPGDDFIPDILGIGTTGVGSGTLTGDGGSVRADNLRNRAGTGAPNASNGLIVTGVATATTFDGNVTGNADTATNAQGLTGTPSITVNGVTAATLSGNGASITNIDAGNIATGIVTTARLGSGTASADTFLNGDGEFKEAGGGAWTYLATATASNSATLEFTSNIDSTYDTYAFVGSHLIPTVDASFLSIQYYDSGASWTQNAYNGALRGNNFNVTVTLGVTANVSIPYFQTTNMNSQASTSNSTARGGVNFIYYVFNPSNTTYYTHGLGHLSSYPPVSVGADGVSFDFSHVYSRTQAVTGVRFIVNDSTTGNIASGTVRMYGIKNS